MFINAHQNTNIRCFLNERNYAKSAFGSFYSFIARLEH